MMRPFSIKSITLNDVENTTIEPQKINVLVGPNSSGKSRMLKEIRTAILGEEAHNSEALDSRVIKGIEFMFPEAYEDFLRHYAIEENLVKTMYNDYVLRDYCNGDTNLDANGGFHLGKHLDTLSSNWKKELEDSYTKIDTEQNSILRFLGSRFVNYCGTEERLLLSVGESFRGLEDTESNFLSTVFLKDCVLEELSIQTNNLFGKFPFFDMQSRGGLIQIRIGSDFNLYQNYLAGKTKGPEIIQETLPLKAEGDGVRSFVIVYLALSIGNKPVLLIDEPESFLHPPQAYQLGKIVGEKARETKELQLFIATHSSHFLEGLLSAPDNSNSTQIIRLDRENNENLFSRVVSPYALQELFENPLLKGTNISDGIFACNVVIVESENDEIVLRSLIDKLFPSKDIRFVNVHGKQNVHTTAAFYRKFGVRCFAIYDFDLLNNRDNLFTKALDSFEVSPDHFHELLETQNRISQEINQKAPTKQLKRNDVNKLHLEQQLNSFKNTIHSIADGMGIINNVFLEMESQALEERIRLFKQDVRYYSTSKLYKKEVPETLISLKDELNSMHQLLKSYGMIVLRTGELETILEGHLEYSSSNKSTWSRKAVDFISQTEKETLEKLAISKDLQEVLDKD